MLFDLQARGRRRTVKVIYATLAVLMGGGLVLFGIGGNTSGGLFDAINGNNSTSASSIYNDRVKAAEKRVEQQPTNAPAWASLAKLRYQQTTAGDGYDQTSGQFTKKGLEQLAGVNSAWTKYLALKPAKVDASTALLMVQALGPGGLNKNDEAVDAMEYVIAGREPSVGLYTQYAQLAYVAGQTRKGDLAAEKAVSLAPKASRTQLKTQLDSLKSQIAQSEAQALTGASGTQTTG